LLTSASVLASDYYVDAIAGNNANAGTSPGSAWRTITYAVSRMPVPSTGIVDVIHVAPGTYDAALGETFPILLADHDALQIVGDGGSAVTILDGGSTSTMIIDLPHPFVGGHTGPLTLVQGVTLRRGAKGVVIAAVRLKSTDLTLRDVKLTQMSDWAVTVDNAGTMISTIGTTVTLDRVEIASNQEGVHIHTDGVNSFGHSIVTIQDSTITHNRGTGIAISDTFDAAGSRLFLHRCRVTDNGADGVRVEQEFGFDTVTVVELGDSLIARNARDGVKIAVPADFGTSGDLTTTISRCTIADNGGYGVDSFNVPYTPPTFGIVMTLDGSILYGNGDDLNDNPAYPTILTPTYCDIGDGDFAGVNGNIALDPLFRAPSSLDYHLVWTSPCIDSGNPARPVDTLDLARTKRPIDGNLDAQEIADIGALEFAPLWSAPTVHVGGSLVLEQWGPAGGTSTLFVARGQPLAVPQSTPFGEFDLDPNNVRNLGAQPVAPGPPFLRTIAIPNDPSFVGVTISLQALSTSSVGSPPMAYTNPFVVTIIP
jgi:hypothetical protein